MKLRNLRSLAAALGAVLLTLVLMTAAVTLEGSRSGSQAPASAAVDAPANAATPGSGTRTPDGAGPRTGPVVDGSGSSVASGPDPSAASGPDVVATGTGPASGSADLATTGTPPVGFAIRIPVFMYHRIAPDSEIGRSLPGLVVSPARFTAQMAALHRAGWTTITARELADDLAAGRRPPRHSFVLTFDDGHVDGYTHAFPILRRYGFVGSFYVITNRIGHTGYLTPAQLRTMAAAGMEIASHTMGHVDLTQLSSTSVRSQLSGSARAIRAAVGVRPITLAYPFGKWNRGLAGPLAATGYRIAFIEGGTCARVTWSSRFAVARLRVERWTSVGSPLARARACSG